MFIKREIVVNRSKVKWLGYFIGGEGVCVVFGSDVHKRKVSGQKEDEGGRREIQRLLNGYKHGLKKYGQDKQ